MMGYTHAAIGAAGAVGVALANGAISPEDYVIATTAGVIGGVLVDIDVRDRKNNCERMTDASRNRLAMLGLTMVCFLLDYLWNYNILQEIIYGKQTTVIGAILFAVILCAARITKGHRTFSHSLLFVFLTTVGISLIHRSMAVYYFIGSLLHILVDLLNNPVPGPNDDWSKKHGIWLLYPIVKGRGIAFRLCKAGGIGNKVAYFVGIITYTAFSGVFCVLLRNIYDSVPVAIVLFYLLVSLHFVRSISEKELRTND